jgi:exonuclease I
MVTRFSEREKGQISSPEVWQENLAKVQGTLDELTELARQVFNSSVPEIELDADLYAGDFLDEIKRERETFNCVSADPFCVMDSSFKSIRLRRLWRRLMARNYFDLICEDHQHKFKQFCFEKFASTDENKWRTRIIFNREYEKAVSDPTLSEKQRHCLISLRNYVEKI